MTYHCQQPNLDLVYTIKEVCNRAVSRAPSEKREFKPLPCKLTAPKALSHFYWVWNNSTPSALSPKRLQRVTSQTMNLRDKKQLWE